MAAASGRRNYPPLLFRKGKAPLQEHSLNYNCYVSNIKTVQEKIGIDAWDAVKMSSIGVIAKLIDVKYIWCAKVVHYLLTHQLATKKNYELWSLIDCQPIRLSLLEFMNITGLNCEAFKAADSFDVDHTPFWGEMNVPTSQGPCLNQL